MPDVTITDQQFADAYNNLADYPTIAQVAATLGMNERSVRRRAARIRQGNGIGAALVSLVRRVPMSELEEKFMEDWTKEDCILELQRIQELDPEMHVTRNYFRHNSKISDATWNRYFGTFEEFCRQAGLKLTRQQHHLEKQIAKHASVDHIRTFNHQRANYADKYVRDNPGKFKTIVSCSDLHDEEVDRFYLRVLIDTCKRVQPDVISITGDLFDLAEFGKYTVDPREWNPVGKMKFVHTEILKAFREACPNAQIDLIEGNHEARLLLMLANATPALRAVLSDLHGFTLGRLLGLDEYEVNYIAKADLATFTGRELEKELLKNYQIYWNCFLAHHFPQGRNMGLPGWNGHHHAHQVWQMFNAIYEAYEWHQMGAGHKRSASYCEGEKWGTGFLINSCNIETRSTVQDYVNTSGDFAVSGGKFYYREASEAQPRILKAA